MGVPHPTSAATSDPIFVIGSSRSGTTLLRQMLSAHPRIHLTMEASFYMWAAAFGLRRQPDAFPPYYVQSFSYRWLRQDPRTILRRLPRPFRREDLPVLFTEVMREAAQARGKVRFGDKTPSHSASLRALFRDYPNARVIRMVRDPREIVNSLLRMPWAPGSVIACTTLVQLEALQVAPYRDRILEVRLSDLLLRPQITMASVLDWVGEPFCAEVLDHATHGPPDLPPMPWFQAARGPMQASPAPQLASAELRVIEMLCRWGPAPLELLPARVAVEPTWWQVLSRFIQGLPRAISIGWTGLRLARALCRGKLDSTAAEAHLRRLNPQAWDELPGFHLPSAPALPADWAESYAAR